MTIRDLIKELQGMDPDALVILQDDEEGNGFATLRGTEAGFWLSEDKEFIEELDDDIREGMKESGDSEIKAVVLYP